MKIAFIGMALSGILLMGQEAGSLLDKAYDGINPDLMAAAGAVTKATTQGFSATQIALASVALPLAYKLLTMLDDTFKDRRAAKAELRARETAEHNAKLTMQVDDHRARLSIPAPASPTTPAGAPASAGTPLPQR